MIRERKDARLVLALAAGATAAAAARQAGVSRATVFRRLQDADFRRAVGRRAVRYLAGRPPCSRGPRPRPSIPCKSSWTTAALRCGGVRRRAFWTRWRG